jgi:hypothetical protein
VIYVLPKENHIETEEKKMTKKYWINKIKKAIENGASEDELMIIFLEMTDYLDPTECEEVHEEIGGQW